MIGVTTDIRHGLTAEDVRRCSFGLARIVLRWDDDPSEILRSCYARGIKTIGIWTTESLDAENSHEFCAQAWYDWMAKEDLLKCLTYLAVGNEPDNDGPSSWPLSPSALSQLLLEVAPPFRETSTIIMGGLAGGDPDYIDGVDLSFVDLIAVHPYGRWPDGNRIWREQYTSWGSPVETFMRGYLHKGRPLCITEYGEAENVLGDLWRRYETEMTQAMVRMQAAGTIVFGSIYGHSHAMNDGFGMLDREGRLTEAGRGVRSVILGQ